MGWDPGTSKPLSCGAVHTQDDPQISGRVEDGLHVMLSFEGTGVDVIWAAQKAQARCPALQEAELVPRFTAEV